MLPHDAACKLLFSFPAMVRDLLAGFFPREWVEELDLSTLERWPENPVSDDLRQRHQDRVWRVRCCDRWLYVLVMLEFQSTIDHTMAVRILRIGKITRRSRSSGRRSRSCNDATSVTIVSGEGFSMSITRGAPLRFKDERATVVTNERSDPVVGEQPIHGGKSGEGRDTCQGSRSLIVAGQRAAAREAVSY